MRIQQRFATIIVISILLSCLMGCASFEYRAKDYGRRPGIYPGARQLIGELTRKSSVGMGAMLPEWAYDTAAVLDLPLSFTFDTLCLPYDVFKNREKDIRLGSARFDRDKSIVRFYVKNNTDKKLSAVVDIHLREELGYNHPGRVVGRKRTSIILPPDSEQVFEESIVCDLETTKDKFFRVRAAIKSYKEAE